VGLLDLCNNSRDMWFLLYSYIVRKINCSIVVTSAGRHYLILVWLRHPVSRLDQQEDNSKKEKMTYWSCYATRLRVNNNGGLLQHV